MDQGYYTESVRRNVGGVKGVDGRSSVGNKNSTNSSSSSSSSKFNQPGTGDRFHTQYSTDSSHSLEWSGTGSLSASTMSYCNIYMNTSSSSSSTNASLESGMDDTSLLPYLSIAALPSKSATRHFCSVCGFFGTYTCTRCGCRFCCSRCLASHKETRCLKFSY